MGEFGRLTRAAAMGGAAVLLALGGLLAAEPAQACACGGMVAPEGENVAVDSEVAALAWDGAREDIVIRLDMLTDADDAAVLIPTPAPPEVQLAAEDFFTDLAEMAAPRYDTQYTWWPQQAPGADAGGADAPEAVGGVQVLETVPLGPLEASVLSATDADGLTDWLRENDYVMSDPLADALTPYISEGWYFVAIRMVAEEGTLTGQVQPVHLTFPASSLIYPMRISAAAQAAQSVTTYVIADGQVRRTDPTWTDDLGELRYAGTIATDLRRSSTWADLVDAGSYLTVMHQEFDRPASQIVSDFTFASAPAAADYQEVIEVTRMRMIAGFPAGPVLLLLGSLVLLGGFLLVRRFLPAGDGGARRAPEGHQVRAHQASHTGAGR